MGKKKKKPLYKKWWFWLIVVVIVGSIGVNGGNEEEAEPSNTKSVEVKEVTASEKEETKSKGKKEVKKETPKPATLAKKETPKADGAINKEKFDQLKDGMSYEQVVALVGDEGTLMSETGQKGTSLYTAMYEFPADGSFGANVSLMFQGDKLMNKAQFGLQGEENKDVKMTLAAYDQLRDGMSYEEATKIIGGEGDVMSETGQKGAADHTVMYEYTGEGDLGANANLMFQGNKLINKSQFGLR
ncbi:DUF3862 domain-containing protein [Priestia koreensis]|uniref:DUF3862 domain-containing protein n=1 Tax=Priestia koreensis TaxID=284581 RepID=UPI0030195815